ncbi:MAG: hypothetical protein JWQ21_3906 [Herminiimonas sp.]|nr:hypothetical protein [Herminiimonas sp.]
MPNLKRPWFASLNAKTRIRLRTTLFASADYAVNVLILFGFAAAGTVSYGIPLKILAIGLVFNAIFLSGIASGFTQRLRDPSMTAIQLLAACGINLLGLLLAPQIAYMFIVNLFVPLSYGSLHFQQRMFLAAWIFLSCALGAAMLTIGEHANIALATPVERLLFWIVMVIALGRFLAINAEVARLRAGLQNKNDQLGAMTARLADLASRDELTGLWNRREFMRLLQDESRRAVRSRSNFCVALIDIDHFKQVNDRFGHLVGDAVLHELAQLLETMRRATDSVARYGGEEFTLLLVGPKLSTATVALERIRNQVAQHNWESAASGLQLTISAGIAGWQPGETMLQVLDRADGALYEAKNAGRNCVRVASV